MLRLAIRNVKRSSWRTSLLIFGILVTIALQTGIVVTVDTIYEEFIFDNRNQNYTDITVNPKSWMDLESLKELVGIVSSVPGVSEASEVYYISSDLIENQSGGMIDIMIYGINPQTHPDYSLLNMSAGSSIIEDDTILVSQPFQRSIDIKLREKLSLEEKPEIGFKGTELAVGGVFTIPPIFGNRDSQFIVLVDINSIGETFHSSYLSRSLKGKIDIKIGNLLKIESIADEIIDTIGPEYNVFVEKKISEIQSLGISAYTTVINLIILASLLLEFLFLTNLLTISIRDRRKEYGILRTVGISSKQLIVTIIYEILIYSIIGIILGILAGIGVANILVTLIDRFYSSFHLDHLSLKPSSLGILIVSGLIITLLAGIYPLYLALKVPVIRNIHYRMRSSDSSLINNYWKYTLIFGFILTISGFIFSLYVTPAKFMEFSVFSSHFLVIIYIFLGTLLIEAGVIILLPKVGEKVLIMFDIVPRQISMRNIAREFHKSLFTLISSSVAITFVILLAIISSVIIYNVPQYFDDQWGAVDLVVETYDNDPFPINFTNELKSNEMIKEVSFIQESRIKIGSINTNIYGVDPSQYATFREKSYEKISSEPTHILLLKETSSRINVLVSDILFNSLNIPLGGNLTIQSALDHPITVTIAAVIKGNNFLGNGKYLYLSSTHFQHIFNTTTANLFICDIYEEFDLLKVQRNITRSYPNLSEVFGVDFYRDTIERSLQFQANLFQILFLQSFVLAGIAQFISMLISTINTEREMGIIRSMGLTKWGVFSTYLAESTILGTFSIIFGLLDGLLGTVLLIWYLSDSIPIQLIFPIDQIVLWLLFSFILILISTIYPALKSSKKEISATISARPDSLLPKHRRKDPFIIRVGNKILSFIFYIALLIIAYFVLVISILIIGYIIVFIMWVFNDIF